MADTRYLKRRGNVYWTRIKVPADVKRRMCREHIEKSLRTGDLREAQRLRWAHVQEAHEKFDRLRGRCGLSSMEIEQAAQRRFRVILEEAERKRQRGELVSEADAEIDYKTGEPWTTDREVAGLDLELDLLYEALDPRWSYVPPHIEEAARELLGEPQADLADHQELTTALLKAEIEATRALLAHRQGQLYQPPPGPFNFAVFDPVTFTVRTTAMPPVRPQGTAVPINGVTFSETAARYVADRMRDPSAAWTQQTRIQNEATFRLFADWCEDRPLASVDRETASCFVEAISRLDPNWGRGKGAKTLSLSQLLDKFGVMNGDLGLSNRTLNRHVNALGALWKWADRQGMLQGDVRSPFSGLTRPTGRKSRSGYQPFTEDELRVLLGSPLLTNATWGDRLHPDKHDTKTAIMWLPLVALFTGMREAEICQLRTGDIREETGITFINVAEQDGTRVQTEAAIRRVPLHSELIACGFLEYVEHVHTQGHQQVFPGLKPGGPDKKLNWYISKAFTTHRRSLGLDRPGLSFHSLRKNVATALERARVPENEAVQLLGHEKMSMSYSVYSLGLDLHGLKDVVERIQYKGLDLRHLHQ
jgi:integrase